VTQGDLSPAVREFIARHLDSAEQLEILLLLQREPEREWTAEETSRSVYTVPASALMRLERLVVDGFAVSSGGSNPTYRYGPATEERRRQVAELAAAYARDRVGVIKLLFGRPPDPLESFSEAFRLKGKRD
jgi:hypothetical protein